MANVSCSSKGWHPEPRLRWSDQKQDLTPKGLQHSLDSSGLQSVHSWILVNYSSEVSCSVGLSDEGAKEARLFLVPPRKEGKDNCLYVCNILSFFSFFLYKSFFSLLFRVRILSSGGLGGIWFCLVSPDCCVSFTWTVVLQKEK